MTHLGMQAVLAHRTPAAMSPTQAPFRTCSFLRHTGAAQGRVPALQPLVSSHASSFCNPGQAEEQAAQGSSVLQPDPNSAAAATGSLGAEPGTLCLKDAMSLCPESKKRKPERTSQGLTLTVTWSYRVTQPKPSATRGAAETQQHFPPWAWGCTCTEPAAEGPASSKTRSPAERDGRQLSAGPGGVTNRQRTVNSLMGVSSTCVNGLLFVKGLERDQNPQTHQVLKQGNSSLMQSLIQTHMLYLPTILITFKTGF